MNEMLQDIPLFGIGVKGAMWQTALCLSVCHAASGKTPLPAAAVTPPNFLSARNRIEQDKALTALTERENAGGSKNCGGIRFATAAPSNGNMFWIEAEAKTTSSIGDLDYTGESVHVRLSSVCGIPRLCFRVIWEKTYHLH